MDFHARAALEHPGAELVAAANWREPSLRRLAERYGIPRVTTDWRALAADPEVDAVVIGTPNALHAAQADRLPGGRQARAGGEADGPHRGRGRRHGGGRPRGRGLPDGGPLLAVPPGRPGPAGQGRGRRAGRDRQDPRLRRCTPAGGRPGGSPTRSWPAAGALLDMGVHAIDTTRYLLGDPRPVRVCAAIGTRYGDYAVDDDAVLLIELVQQHQLGGRVGLVAAAGWAAWRPTPSCTAPAATPGSGR